jgi:hypothetical protein
MITQPMQLQTGGSGIYLFIVTSETTISRPHLSLQVAFQGEIVSLQFDVMMLSLGVAVPCISVTLSVSRLVDSVGLSKEQL